MAQVGKDTRHFDIFLRYMLLEMKSALPNKKDAEKTTPSSQPYHSHLSSSMSRLLTKHPPEGCPPCSTPANEPCICQGWLQSIFRAA